MTTLSVDNQVPRSLRRWFVIHFSADIIFAIPLLLIPEVVLPIFGWTVVDPITSRLTGAALLGIGVESLLGRNASREVFEAMLNLKILWASGAVLGIALGHDRRRPAGRLALHGDIRRVPRSMDYLPDQAAGVQARLKPTCRSFV